MPFTSFLKPLLKFYLFTILLFVIVTFLSLRTAAATLPSGFTETSVSGLSSPTSVSIHPDGRIFVTQQGGALRIIKNGALLATPFVTVSTTQSGERGLLGVAFDPDYATNHYVYVYYTALTPAIHNRVSRFTADVANEDVAVAGSEIAIVDLDDLSGATNHNGGAIHFGPDGKLYIAVGENANSAHAQSLSNRLGKILRVNSDGSVPADNPTTFPNIAGSTTGLNRAIWAVGLRNPYTFSFQSGTGRMFINDVGQVTWEEIDDGIAGTNYGWPTCEGIYLQGTTTPCNTPGLTDSIYTYSSSTASECAITGGDFYNPTNAIFPVQYQGKYFFSDFCGGWIKYIDPASPSGVGLAATFATGISSPIDIDVAVDGSLYYLARGAGSVFRIQYTAGTSPTPTNTPTNTPTLTPTATFTPTATATPTMTLTPFPEYDLTISQADSPDPVNVGQQLTYTLTVTNAPSALGGFACPNVRFGYPTGVQFSFNSTSGTNGYTATPDVNGITFSGGCLSSSGGVTATATLTVVITPLATGTLTSLGSSVVVDPENAWHEDNENNNTAATIQTTVAAATPTNTPTNTATATHTSTNTPTPTMTITPFTTTPTSTPTNTPINTSTPTATNTATSTPTPLPPVNIVGLTTSGALVTFSSTNPGTTSNPVTVTGLAAGETLFGIDIRPVDNVLIGLGFNSTNGTAHVYSINTVTGAAASINPNTLVLNSGLSFPSRIAIDFNPTANALRIVTNASTGNNLRIPSGGTGSLVTDTDLNPSGHESIKTTAYSRNNPGGGTNGATTLYEIGVAGNLLTQGSIDYFTGNGVSPNSGTIMNVAPLTGVQGTAVFGFDIYNTPGTAAASPGIAYLVTPSVLYSLDLNTGIASLQGIIGGGLVLKDITAGSPSTPPSPTPTNTPTATSTATFTSTPTATATSTPSTVRAAFDYDGDHKADISVFRPSSGAWYLQQSQAGLYGALFGFGTDKIAPADYDGDGKTDIAVYRPSTGIWYVWNSSNGTFSYTVFGLAEDLPTPADYDGDGKADISVFRPSTGTWYRQNSSNGSFFGVQFGASEDKPTIGDFDGDGKSDIAVFRPSSGAWYRINSSDNSIYGELFGFGSDILTPADYDGDGKTDLSVFRPSTGIWYSKKSSNSNYTAFVFGLADDIPAPADYDGDGHADFCVFRPSDGTWYRNNSSNTQFIAFQFGTNGDKPTQTAFRY